MSKLILDKEQAEDIRTYVFDEPEESNSDADLKAELLTEALGSDPDSFILIHRQVVAGSAEEYIARFPADKYDYGQLLEYLRENHGGGDYRVRLYVKGRLKKGGNKLIQIARPLNNTSKPTSEAGDILATVLQQIEANNNRMIQMMAQLAKPVDSRKEMLQEMIMYKQLFGGNQKSEGLGQIQEALNFVKELGIPIGGAVIEQEKEEGFGDLIEKMAPLVTAALQRPVAPTNNAVKPNPQKRDPAMMQKIMMKQMIAPYIKAASKNSDPAMYAELLIDQIGESLVKEHITKEGAIEKLQQMLPEVVPYSAWFLMCAEHAKAMLNLPSTVSHLYDDDENDITDIDLNTDSDNTNNEPADL